jgi:hypothetical protein
VVVSGLTGPHSIEWSGGCLYVAENDKVSRHCDTNADGSLDQHARIVDLPTGGNHTSRTLHFGPDGKLYVSVGSTCNVCVEPDVRRAAILRFNPDGSIPADNPFANDANPQRRPVWAEGLRNSIDFVFMPDGQLWANHNGRDNMVSAQAKNERPLEEIVIPVQGGRHHGWPFCTSERIDGGTEPGVTEYTEVADPSGGAGHGDGCSPLGADRHRALRRRGLPGRVPRRRVRGAARLVEPHAPGTMQAGARPRGEWAARLGGRLPHRLPAERVAGVRRRVGQAGRRGDGRRRRALRERRQERARLQDQLDGTLSQQLAADERWPSAAAARRSEKQTSDLRQSARGAPRSSAANSLNSSNG